MSWSTQLEPQLDDWWVFCNEYYNDLSDFEITTKYLQTFPVEKDEVPSIKEAIDELVEWSYWERTFV